MGLGLEDVVVLVWLLDDRGLLRWVLEEAALWLELKLLLLDAVIDEDIFEGRQRFVDIRDFGVGAGCKLLKLLFLALEVRDRDDGDGSLNVQEQPLHLNSLGLKVSLPLLQPDRLGDAELIVAANVIGVELWETLEEAVLVVEENFWPRPSRRRPNVAVPFAEDGTAVAGHLAE